MVGSVVHMSIMDVSTAAAGQEIVDTFANDPNGSDIPIHDITTPPPCQWILYEDIADSRVRIWDLVILIPNVLFLCFLLLNGRTAFGKLKSTNSHIFAAFYGLVMIVVVISILRCVVAMTVNASLYVGDVADKLLWLILRFFLLATELSVVIFGLAFGHLDSKTSIRRVLLVTSFVALVYSVTQGALEFRYPDPKFHIQTSHNETESFDIFAHGGMIFWLSSSIFFFLTYSLIFILPWTFVRHRVQLPAKKAFYYYALLLSVLNLVQAIGSAFIYFNEKDGHCMVDVTTYIYFTLFDPLVYGTFLRDFFRKSQPSILFSYKHQTDELPEEDTVSMPYQTPYGKSEIDDSQNTGSYNSTHFDQQNSLIINRSVNDGNISDSQNSDHYFQIPM